MIGNSQKQWDFLKNKFESRQLSHAYLFSGEKNLGKKNFAKELIKLVNCLQTQPNLENEKPCQKCVNCQMIERGTFPDFLVVEPEAGREIPISKIREVQNFLNYKPYYSSAFKSVIVKDAEKMNQEAQSCFLKTLEEPRGKTLLILISSKPDMLLSTIMSRCQVIKFLGRAVLDQKRVDEENKILSGLLKVAGCDFSEKFKYVKSLDLEQQELGDTLGVLQKYLRHLLFLKTGVGSLEDQGHFLEISSQINSYSVEKIKKIINLTEDINNKLIFTNANPKLALEILLMEI